jgi:hypothetical protein
MNRREQLFLLWAISATGVALVLAAALVLLALPRQPARFSLGRADQFPPGSFLDMNLSFDFSDPLAISHTTMQVVGPIPPLGVQMDWVVKTQRVTWNAGREKQNSSHPLCKSHSGLPRNGNSHR